MFKKSNMDNNESQEESEMLWLYPADREKLNFKPNYEMLKVRSLSSDESSSDDETQASSTIAATSTAASTPPA